MDPPLGVANCQVCHGLGWIRGPVSIRPMEGERNAMHFHGVPCDCRRPAIEAARRARLRLNANLPHEREGEMPRTFEMFKTRKGAEAAVVAARRWAEGDGPNILTLTGQYGSGKSHLVEASVRRLVDRGSHVRYEFVPDLFDRIKATYSRDAEEQTSDVLEQYHGAEALALDDLGAHNATSWARAQLVSIVDDFYRNGRRLIVASNLLTPPEMAANLDGRVASRLFDRASGTVHVAFMACGDYRLGEAA